MIQRQDYLDSLISFRDKQLIKVVTGIRRCGKSTLFELFQDYLRADGITDEQIIAVNLEEGEYDWIQNYKHLYDFVVGKLVPGKQMYTFIDEVQRVTDFQKAIDSLYEKMNCDVYITGSNAHLLSGELATLLSGRYVEIKMLPLSFKEYISNFPEDKNLERLYQSIFKAAHSHMRFKSPKPKIDGYICKAFMIQSC